MSGVEVSGIVEVDIEVSEIEMSGIEVSGSGQRLVEPTTLDGISTSLSSNRSGVIGSIDVNIAVFYEN